MDRSRKANRRVSEETLQHKSRQEALLVEELAEENLARLQATIQQLQQSPAGAAELERRVASIGQCLRIDGETASQFYERLRLWLERELPPTKLPLHPPRQNQQPT